MPDGSSVLIMGCTASGRSGRDWYRKAANRLLDEKGAIWRATVDEVWVSDIEGGARSGEADNRQEAILITAMEGESQVAARIPIERDRETREPSLGPIEHGGEAA